jgi:hypothetical protein
VFRITLPIRAVPPEGGGCLGGLARRTVMTALPGGHILGAKLADLLDGALELSPALLLEQPIEMAAHTNRNNEANITRCRCTMPPATES